RSSSASLRPPQNVRPPRPTSMVCNGRILRMDGADRSAAVARFLDDAASLVARSGPVPGPATFAAIGEALRGLAGQPGMVDDERLAGLRGSSASAAIIGRHADGSVLMLSRFPAEAPTPIHNHN